MKTYNQEYFDALIRNQIAILLLSESLRKKTISLLNKTERDISAQIITRLEGHGGINSRSLKKLEGLQSYIKTVRGESWDEIDALWVSEVIQFAKGQTVVMASIAQTVVPVILDLNLPAPLLLEGIVETNPFQGRTLKEWASTIRSSDLNRISDEIKIGMVQGETSPQIARRVVGTVAQKGKDGVTQITRNNAASITRTAINSISNKARSSFYQANKDIFNLELFVATLDSKTTPVCRANDGKTYPVGVGPIPALHFSCRSLRIAIFNNTVIGERPFKASTEKQLIGEYAKQNNLPTNLSKRTQLPMGHKGKYDAFSRDRVRELTGTVPAKVNYSDWLKTQSKDFQDGVLGITKARLFRDGKMPLDKFVTPRGKEKNLAQLASDSKKYFKSAGLDPDDFI
jgi:SPP1 gp7 family putative phage head morphogenesis protein